VLQNIENLEDLQNLGVETSKRLRSVGIKTPKDLAEVGAVDAYCMLKITYSDTTKVDVLIAIQGALMDVPWQDVPSVLSDNLKLEAWEILRVQNKI
jgi:DNA transformation protein